MRCPRAVTRLLGVVGLTLGLLGCSQTTQAGPGRVAQVGLSEYRLTPQRLQASAGPLTLVVHNFGHLVHNLAVMRGSRVIEETAPIAPGSSVTLAVALTPGRYTLGSNLFDDQSLGAYGTLVVGP